MSIGIDNNYDKYDYTQQVEPLRASEEEEEQESLFEKFVDGVSEITNVFTGTLEELKDLYNTYIQAQEDGFEEDTDKEEVNDDVENTNLFKDGVETDANGEAKVTVVKWTGDSSENSTLFGIINNHYNLDAVKEQNPELKDYSDEDLRFYIANEIAKKNGIADINVIEIGDEFTLPNLTASKDVKDDTDNTEDIDNTDTIDEDGEAFLNELRQAGGDAWNEFDRLSSTLGLSKEGTAEYLLNLCKETGENCIDPVVFTALLRQESGYNKDAVGDGGLAIGLGQLQPIAVEQLNQWYPDKNYSNGDRYDAYKNLEMTMMCIKGHYNEYVNAYGTKPSLQTLLGAYNQGWITLADNSDGRQYARDVLSRLDYYSI